MMRYFLFISILLPALGSSQSKPDKWALKFNATAFIDIFSFPTLQFGVERKLNDRMSVQVELGFQPYSNHSNIDTTFLKDTGYKLMVELRHYFGAEIKMSADESRQSGMMGIYFSGQFFHTQNTYNASQSYFDIASTTFPSGGIDFFTVKRSKLGGRVLFGRQGKIFSRFIYDTYIGLGGVVTEITNAHREFDPAVHGKVECIDFCFDRKELSEESGPSVSFSYGIRLGYVF